MNHVIAVTKLDDRDKLIRAMRDRYALKILEQPGIRIVQDKIHRLLIYDGEQIIHTITVVTIPILCNLDPLEEMCGADTKFTVSALIDQVDKIKGRLIQILHNPDRRRSRNLINDIVDHLTF